MLLLTPGMLQLSPSHGTHDPSLGTALTSTSMPWAPQSSWPTHDSLCLGSMGCSSGWWCTAPASLSLTGQHCPCFSLAGRAPAASAFLLTTCPRKAPVWEFQHLQIWRSGLPHKCSLTAPLGKQRFFGMPLKLFIVTFLPWQNHDCLQPDPWQQDIWNDFTCFPSPLMISFFLFSLFLSYTILWNIWDQTK